MTLKQFLEENNIKVTNDQRSRIGYALKWDGESIGYVPEKNYMVNDYPKEYFQLEKTQKKILKFLVDG